MAPSVRPISILNPIIKAGGQSQVAVYGPALGGYIVNPASATDQGLLVPEPLFIDMTGAPAVPMQTGTCFPIGPGTLFPLPANFASVANVTAASTNHKFGGVVFQPPINFQPSTDMFPPAAQTSVTKVIPSYLYWQYSDDEDLQAFVAVFNSLAQQIVDWFVDINLPIYPELQGALLDWVAAGVYGITRPSLPSGMTQTLGPLNTAMFNELPLNVEEVLGPPNYYLTSDDVFQRIITWHFFKGDGKQMDIRRLKRMVMRFLTIANGWGGPIDNTYPVSVTFGTDGQVNINLQSIRRYSTGGALFNAGELNTFALNELDTRSVTISVSPLVPIFKAAMDAGVLEFPFQFTPIVNI